MSDLPIDPDAAPDDRRNTLLRAGDTFGWWRFESANGPGYTDRHGMSYEGVTYTIVRPGTGPAVQRERVLAADEVCGYVLRAAEEHDAVASIAYRPGLDGPAAADG